MLASMDGKVDDPPSGDFGPRILRGQGGRTTAVADPRIDS